MKSGEVALDFAQDGLEPRGREVDEGAKLLRREAVAVEDAHRPGRWLVGLEEELELVRGDSFGRLGEMKREQYWAGR